MKKIMADSSDKKLFSKVWRLYEKSFPEEEKRSLNQHIKAIEDHRFHPCAYISEQEEVKAICFYWCFFEFIYLEHLAVDPNLRNRGIGSKIIKDLQLENRYIILEIEPPINKISKQRLAFYERNNFKRTGYAFRQLKYKPSNDDVCLELLCNRLMDKHLFEIFQNTIYQELQIYCDN